MLSHLSIVSVMLLPKFVVTAYLALQSQNPPTENHGSLEQIQNPLGHSRPQHEVSEVADYVIEINGQPVATEHIDVKIPHGQTLDKSTTNTHRTSSNPHALKNKYVTFDDWKTGSVEGQSKDGVELKGGSIYDISEFPNIRNDYGVSKFWGIPTDDSYETLILTLDKDIAKFVYNIGYIVNGTLTAGAFDVWYGSETRKKLFVQVESTWINNLWKKGTLDDTNLIKIVLTGYFSGHGILAFYDWGYSD